MLQQLSKHVAGFSSVALFGGSSLAAQRRELDSRPDLVIATPGRLVDHLLNTKGFVLDEVEVLVLDEADRLIEMGFADEVKRLVTACNHPRRQTIMVSATLTQDLRELQHLALKQALEFTVNKQ